MEALIIEALLVLGFNLLKQDCIFNDGMRCLLERCTNSRFLALLVLVSIGSAHVCSDLDDYEGPFEGLLYTDYSTNFTAVPPKAYAPKSTNHPLQSSSFFFSKWNNFYLGSLLLSKRRGFLLDRGA